MLAHLKSQTAYFNSTEKSAEEKPYLGQIRQHNNGEEATGSFFGVLVVICICSLVRLVGGQVYHRPDVDPI